MIPAGSVEPPPPIPPTSMAKHKAPTQVTILREEKSLMQAWVDRYWKTFAALAVALLRGAAGVSSGWRGAAFAAASLGLASVSAATFLSG